jgi:hypothetical protein
MKKSVKSSVTITTPIEFSNGCYSQFSLSFIENIKILFFGVTQQINTIITNWNTPESRATETTLSLFTAHFTMHKNTENAKNMQDDHDDEEENWCFECKEGGQLVFCDHK